MESLEELIRINEGYRELLGVPLTDLSPGFRELLRVSVVAESDPDTLKDALETLAKYFDTFAIKLITSRYISYKKDNLWATHIHGFFDPSVTKVSTITLKPLINKVINDYDLNKKSDDGC